MSGNNPNILYSLNVLGNATVQGILDCTEVAIDNVVTENVETDSLTVNGPATVTTLQVSGKSNTGVLKINSTTTVDSSSVGGYLGYNDDGQDQLHFSCQRFFGSGGFVWKVFNTNGVLETTPMSITRQGALSTILSVSSPTITAGTSLVTNTINPSSGSTIAVNANLNITSTATVNNITSNQGLQSLGNPVTKATQGHYITWNETSGDAVYSNNRGVGAGGFVWKSFLSDGTLETTPMTLTRTGDLSVGGGVNTRYTLSTNVAVIGNGNRGLYTSIDTSTDEGVFSCQRFFGSGGFKWAVHNTSGVLEATPLTLSAAGNAVFAGKVISVPNCFTYLSSSTTAITAGVPTNMLHWGVNGAAANSGDALTYNNATGRFSNALGRTVLAIITITARTDVQAGTLTASLQSSSLSGGASVSTVQLGDYVALSASIVMGPAAYFSLQGIASVGAAWQTTGACITVTLF